MPNRDSVIFKFCTGVDFRVYLEPESLPDLQHPTIKSFIESSQQMLQQLQQQMLQHKSCSRRIAQILEPGVYELEMRNCRAWLNTLNGRMSFHVCPESVSLHLNFIRQYLKLCHAGYTVRLYAATGMNFKLNLKRIREFWEYRFPHIPFESSTEMNGQEILSFGDIRKDYRDRNIAIVSRLLKHEGRLISNTWLSAVSKPGWTGPSYSPESVLENCEKFEKLHIQYTEQHLEGFRFED